MKKIIYTLSICLISQFVYAAGSDSSSGDSTPKYFTDAKKLVKRAGKLEKKEKNDKRSNHRCGNNLPKRGKDEVPL